MHNLTLQTDRVSKYWVGRNPREKYREDGYLYKLVTMRSLITDGVFPTLEELQKFQGSTGGKSDDAVQALSRLGPRRAVHWNQGDSVKVTEGDMTKYDISLTISLIGIIESIKDDHLIIKPTNIQAELGIDRASVPASQVQKHFKAGDHVKIIAGRYEGETGLIVSVKGNMVDIYSDLSLQEIKVLIQVL